MRNNLCIAVFLAVLGFLSVARAETVYVAERVYIGLRADATDAGAVVKTIESGAPLEVLQRLDRFVQVRDRQGTEGWIEGRYLTAETPARPQLAKLQEELTKTRAQAAEAQAKLKKAEAALAEQTAKAKTLEEAADKPATPVPPPASPAPQPPTVAPAPTGGLAAETGFRFSLFWLVISFAMLGLGFAGGIFWLRESIRKRSGGMYLRV